MKKKSCYGCKALRLTHYCYTCSLRFAIGSNGVPKEVCPKPRTYKKLVELLGEDA